MGECSAGVSAEGTSISASAVTPSREVGNKGRPARAFLVSATVLTLGDKVVLYCVFTTLQAVRDF